MKKKVLFFILVVGFIFSVFGQNVSDFEYTESQGGITITGYNGRVRDIIIPERINGLPVYSIGNRAFSNKQLTSVMFSSNILHIGEGAFALNELTTITLPISIMNISNGAFAMNQITNISFSYDGGIASIPMMSFGDFVFIGNPLSSVTLPYSISMLPSALNYYSIHSIYVENRGQETTFNISLTAFYDFEIAIVNNSVIEITGYNGNNKNIIIPERINGLPVIAIGVGAFEDKQLTTITLPSSISYIGMHAFAGNQITNIILPNNLVYIDRGAFFRNQLTSVIVSNDTYIHPDAFSYTVRIEKR